MNKFSYLIAGLAVLIFSLVSVSAYAAGPMSMCGRTHEDTRITGKIVRNPQGDYLGQIGDVARGSDGCISIVALNQYPTFGTGMAWRRVAIPFDALKYDADKGHYVLNVTKERLASAPDFRNEDINNQEWMTGVYRYYGLQPSWTEKGSSGYMGNPIERWEENHWMEKHPNPMGGAMDHSMMDDHHDDY